MPEDDAAPSERTRVRRGAPRAVYDRTHLLDILAAGMVAHVGVLTDDGPLVLPMAYGHDDHRIFLHGAAGNGLLRAALGAQVCVTVTLVDGLVIARTPFHDSMNYRSVVVRGLAEEVVGADREKALRSITDHVVANWDTGRPPNAAELRRTLVVSLPLDEMSGKVRTGDPGDEDDDLYGPHWGGTVPLRRQWGAPQPSEDLTRGIDPPAAVQALAGLTLP